MTLTDFDTYASYPVRQFGTRAVQFHGGASQLAGLIYSLRIRQAISVALNRPLAVTLHW